MWPSYLCLRGLLSFHVFSEELRLRKWSLSRLCRSHLDDHVPCSQFHQNGKKKKIVKELSMHIKTRFAFKKLFQLWSWVKWLGKSKRVHYLEETGELGQVRAGADGGLDTEIRENVRGVVGLSQACTELRREPRLHIPLQHFYFATSLETFLVS